MSPTPPAAARGIVLFAHGARDPEWAQPMRAIRQTILERDPLARVELAFLEFIAPTLPEAIDRLAGEGCGRVVVVPLFMAQTGHTKRDLPALLEAVRARHPQLVVDLALPIGEVPTVVAAIADYALGG